MNIRTPISRVLPVIMVAWNVLAASAQAQLSQQGSKLVGTGAGQGATEGWSVSLSGDGNTAFVGGYNYGDSGPRGYMRVHAGCGASKRCWLAPVP